MGRKVGYYHDPEFISRVEKAEKQLEVLRSDAAKNKLDPQIVKWFLKGKNDGIKSYKKDLIKSFQVVDKATEKEVPDIDIILRNIRSVRATSRPELTTKQIEILSPIKTIERLEVVELPSLLNGG